MKTLKNILFRSNQEKLTEKVFTQSIAVSVIGILLCVVALCSTTWAWFSENISSTASTIQASNCDMTVSVQQIDGETLTKIEPSEGKYVLKANDTYKITLKAVGTAESAYATVKIGDETYYTEQFNVYSPETNAEGFIFELRFSQDTKIEIVPHWGTSSQNEREFDNDKTYFDLIAQFPQAEPEQDTIQSAETPEPSEVTTSIETTEPAETTEPVEQVQGE